MDKFETASEKERELMVILFKKYGITDYTFTDISGYDQVDGYYTSKNGEKYVFEVKNRNVLSTDYDSTIIETAKVNYLTNHAHLLNQKAILFFFFNDNKWMSKEVHKDDDWCFSTTYIKCPKTTVVDSKMVYKECIKLDITKLKTINYEI